MGVGQFDERFPYLFQNSFVPADTTVIKSLGATSGGSTRVDSVLATNSDTIAHVIQLSVNVGGTDRLIGSATIPAGQGFAGTPALDVLALSLPATQVGLTLPENDYLRGAMEVTVNTAKVVTVVVVGGRI